MSAQKPKALTILLCLVFVVDLALADLSIPRTARADDPVIAPQGLIASCVDAQTDIQGTADQDAWEWEVIRLVNEERASRGIPPLKFNVDLQTAGRVHAQDLGTDNYFAHDSYDYNGSSWSYDKSWSDRIDDYFNGSSLAENVAAGYGSPESVMSAWMSSDGHRNNILTTYRREIGVGYYYDTSDAANIYIPGGNPETGNGPFFHYWVQDFGSRSGVYPVIINSEAYSTTTSTVDLYVYGPSDAQQMRFSNDNVTWSSWETYDANKTWNLATGGSGTRTVYAQVRNSSQTFSASDDIQYLPDSPVLSVDPTQVAFLTEQGSGLCLPSSQGVQVSNVGGGTMSWSSSESSAWFQATDGANVITVTCVANVIDDYVTGERTRSLTITAPGAENSPQTVTVKLVVTENIYSVYLPLVSRDYSAP